jgi:hypothetical protein
MVQSEINFNTQFIIYTFLRFKSYLHVMMSSILFYLSDPHPIIPLTCIREPPHDVCTSYYCYGTGVIIGFFVTKVMPRCTHDNVISLMGRKFSSLSNFLCCCIGSPWLVHGPNPLIGLMVLLIDTRFVSSPMVFKQWYGFMRTHSVLLLSYHYSTYLLYCRHKTMESLRFGKWSRSGQGLSQTL